MINRLKGKWMAHKWVLLMILASGATQLAGCGGKCKSTSSPTSVALIQVSGQCQLASDITCTCSGGGALSSCSAGTQTYYKGTVPPNTFAPCPPIFDCTNTGNCSTNL